MQQYPELRLQGDTRAKEVKTQAEPATSFWAGIPFTKKEFVCLKDAVYSQLISVKMKRSKLIIIITIAFVLLSFQYMLVRSYIDFVCHGNPYIIPHQPGDHPLLFCPKIVSTKEHGEYGIQFSADGTELYFTRTINHQSLIMHSELTMYGWSQPRPMKFMDEYPGGAPCLSYDGSRLMYLLPGLSSQNDEAQLLVAKRQWWGWDTPHMLQEANLIRAKQKASLSLARNGNLYFSGDLDGSGQQDIYVSEFRNNQYMPPRNAGIEINSPCNEGHVYVAPDESYLLFDSDRPGSEGSSDLYISFRKDDGSWTTARTLGASINSHYAEWMPYVSPDGQYLFFSRSIGETVDIYWVSASIIESRKRTILNNDPYRAVYCGKRSLCPDKTPQG